MLTLRGVEKAFPVKGGLLPVLQGIDFDLGPTDYAVVQGASGSGKSTLLSLMAGLDRPTAGALTLDGDRLDLMDESALARVRRDKVGFVFQSFHLIPALTVLENVVLPRAFRGGRFSDTTDARALLERVGLAARMDFFPDQLSGGERQRVAIARALINNPRIVFADEPTGNLDSRTGRAVLDLLEEHTVHAGRALVMVTHDADIAARARQHWVMADGRLSPSRP